MPTRKSKININRRKTKIGEGPGARKNWGEKKFHTFHERLRKTTKLKRVLMPLKEMPNTEFMIEARNSSEKQALKIIKNKIKRKFPIRGEDNVDIYFGADNNSFYVHSYSKGAAFHPLDRWFQIYDSQILENLGELLGVKKIF
ncbi:MAG: hypothetical protein Q7S21_05255 [archaeon]|nr:hypothetical protein [archaeon]